VQIAALRRVLGEEPGGENWIETLPRRGYRFVGPASIRDQGAVTAASAAANFPMAAGSSNPTLPDRPSVAVLPFQNISADPEQEYFADGMADEIPPRLLQRGGMCDLRGREWLPWRVDGSDGGLGPLKDSCTAAKRHLLTSSATDPEIASHRGHAGG
jgi:hypothetical protein